MIGHLNALILYLILTGAIIVAAETGFDQSFWEGYDWKIDPMPAIGGFLLAAGFFLGLAAMVRGATARRAGQDSEKK